MIRSRTLRTLAGVLAPGVGAGLIASCTHDFAVFDPDRTTMLSGGDADADANAPPTRTDAAASDAANADAGCTQAAACVTRGDTCNGMCDADFNACAGKCGGGNSGRSCKERCTGDRDRCKGTCSSTCRTCATALCDDACR